MPRLIIAFASVGALAATANLIVENGVAILEHQRSVAMERSALDAQQIIALRESMGRARRAAMSAEVLGAWGEFDRAAQEHADADSRASAHALCACPRHAGSRARQVSRRDRSGSEPAAPPHRRTQEERRHARAVPPRSPRAAHAILESADGHGHARQDFDRAELENLEPCRRARSRCSRFARSSTRCARRSRLVVHSTRVSWTRVRSPVRNELSRPRCATGRRRCVGHRERTGTTR